MNTQPITRIDQLTALSEDEIDELCSAAEKAILDGSGFGWLAVPSRHVLEKYWRGVLLMPQRDLFVARLDGAIVGSTQLLRPPPNNEAQAHAVQLTTFFIAPWARGHGLARGLLAAVEAAALKQGYVQVDADMRASQVAATQLAEACGYLRWGEKPHYAMVNGASVPGYFYSKRLVP
ncbi:GNAT family N-acetyltransferase [Ferrovibrio sp. MS7]|jgi:RimJ/RimL family protein N-acetyltransferase|uniref:GNAT family N-acetyltransferase n=1 Tax=Ferrovibrio TaxID=1231242 RepID=UPI001B65770B|nr:GNAT family N-acetyltransferase [Ferrovibrio sp.]